MPGDPDAVAATLGLRGFEVASVEHGRAAGHRLRDHREPSRLPERDRPGARGVGGLRPAAAAARIGRCRRPGSRSRSTITIEDAELCPRYCAQVFEVRSTGASPAWMRERLEAGRRPQHQRHRRRHQLRDARDGPADACVRLREAGRAARCGSGARSRARSCGRWTASTATLAAGHAGDRRRRARRRRSAA